jgi:hypothetical protein
VSGFIKVNRLFLQAGAVICIFVENLTCNIMKRAIISLLSCFILFSAFAQKPVVGPLMTTNWNTFQWPLNALLPACSPDTYGAVNGHIGNACGPTAIAKLLHYNRHPEHGKGSHSYADPDGYYFSANFEGTYYKWNLMKDEFSSNPSKEEYLPTAELMLHSHVMMEDPYQTGRSLEDICKMLKKYMRYSEDAYVAYRFDYSRQGYIDLLKSELDAGRTILIESWTSTSTPPGQSGNHAGHYWNIDGYDEQDRFHIALNNDNFEGWYDIHSINLPGIDFDAYYIWALIGAEPDNTAKEFSLEFSEGQSMFKINESVDIGWEQRNISNVNIDFSYNGNDWVNIGENIATASGSWQWEGPEMYSRNAAFRVRDAVNPYYDFTFPGYQVYEEQQLSLVSPPGGDTFETGTELCVSWMSDGLPFLNIEYKESQSEEWLMVEEEIPGMQMFYRWPLPGGSGKTYDVRVSTPDGSFSEVASGIKVTNKQQTGGPYKKDYDTWILMHFDSSLDEEVFNLQAVPDGLVPEYDLSVPGKGAALRLDNEDRSSQSSLVIPHQDFLSLRGSFTLDLWFMINSWDMAYNNKPNIISKPIMSTRSNYSFTGFASRGSVAFKARTTSGDAVVECTQGIIVPGVWYHAAMIHDETKREMKLLIHNSRKERIDEQSYVYPEGAGLQTSTMDLLIGKSYGGGSYFDGYIDELRISRVVRDFDAVWSGIHDINKDAQFNCLVYPVPSSDKVYVDLQEAFVNAPSVWLMDVQGRVVPEFEGLHQNKSSNIISFDVTGLSPGIYWLKIESGSKGLVKKIVVSR